MIAGFYTVVVVLIGIFVVRSLLINRDNGIVIKGGIVMFLTTLLMTFGNSLIEGGQARIGELFQLNMITSSVSGIIVGVLFFWKKDDLYAYFDENHILIKQKNPLVGSIVNFEEWQKERDEIEKAAPLAVDEEQEQLKRAVRVDKADVLKRIQKDREHIRVQGADHSPQIRFETGKELSKEEELKRQELMKQRKKMEEMERNRQTEVLRQKEGRELAERERERTRKASRAQQEEQKRKKSASSSSRSTSNDNLPYYSDPVDYSSGSCSSSSSSSSSDSGSSSSSSDSGGSSCD